MKSVVQLERDAATAWTKYDSTVRLGGTPQERIWAFNRALAAEAQLAITRGQAWPVIA